MELQSEFKDPALLRRIPYKCSIEEASITAPGTIISKFIGTHEPNQDNSCVEIFEAENCKIKYFPIGLSSIFVNLKCLSIVACELMSLARKDLNGLEELEEIYFDKNNLTELPSDLFVGFGKLKIISFSNNKLEFLSSELMEPVLRNGLYFVSFRHNPKIDAMYDKEPYEDKAGAVITLKQLMDKMDECEKPKGEGFDLKNFHNGNFGRSFFADLWDTKAFSDFTIVTKDSKEIQVHKFVLGMQSSVFAAFFNIDMDEKRTNRMVIDTFSPEAVVQFLKTFYIGRVPDDVHAIELFALASKYALPQLKKKCEHVVLRNLDKANAFDVFVLSHYNSATDMKQRAFNMIKESMPKRIAEGLREYPNYPEKLQILVKAARECAQIMQEAYEKNKILKHRRFEDSQTINCSKR